MSRIDWTGIDYGSCGSGTSSPFEIYVDYARVLNGAFQLPCGVNYNSYTDGLYLNKYKLPGNKIYRNGILYWEQAAAYTLTINTKCIGAGQGYVNILKNGSLEAQATPGYPATIQTKTGDIVTWYCSPYTGNKFIRLCDNPQTECSTTTSTSATISTDGNFTMYMEATFEKVACVPNWQCWQGHAPYEVDGCGNQRENVARCGGTPPPPGTNISLAVDKPNVKPGDQMTFTATTDLPAGTIIKLFERVPLGSDFEVGSATVSGGKAIFTKTAGIPATIAYYASGGGIIIPYTSNLVTIYISETGGFGGGYEQYIPLAIGAIVLSSLLRR